ncbi:OmpP1/FadL family transporter [Flavobacterium sp. K5-23]|uniref:OmpP1/FadL family transporter n=1 Tax=Flavobacterium sp. K5-23 TaxID=2746225 RepID=UPI00200DA665|nr:outer membrane protein transport protein [Flavobacterium sp. K5-23]UQD57441.1 outer membrane protein transport protein [Flavobacterium sp. K5-23]
MKKHIYLLLVAFAFSGVQGQEIKDAVRYSQDNLNGTARFRAMSGAFGALGGDLSSLNVNPAGSAVFSNNQIGVTISNYDTKNNSNYFGTKTTETNNSLDLNQAGGVFVFKNQNSTSDWKKFSIAVNYENTNNFDNSFYSEGINPTNSIGKYFLSYANGVPLDKLENSSYSNLPNGAQQAYIGYQGYIINPVSNSPTNTQYTSNIPGGGNYFHENSIISNGYNGKLSFNGATSYKDKLYIGLNLNSHFTDLRQSSSFYEDNSAPLTSEYTVSKLRFDNDLYTYGTGFSFQLGAIAKVSNEVRLGIAYESSTWYTLNDEFSQKLVAVSSKTNADDTNDVVDPQIINVYAPYKLQTPSKVTGSFAYIFGKKGLISLDYAIKDYSNTKFKPENDIYFKGLNNSMSTILDNTSELRIGGEYKIEKLSLRAGYRFEQSPYKNGTTVGDLTGYSGGLGYNFGSTKLDLSYAYAKRESQQGFFNQGFTDGAIINSINNNISLTLLFEL